MRKIRSAVFAGAAALATGGTAAAAAHDAQPATANLSPRPVRIVGQPIDAVPLSVILADRMWGPAAFGRPLAVFARMERVMAAMDRHFDMMFARPHAMPRIPLAPRGGMHFASFGDLPPGTVSYSFVSMSNGKTRCTRSVRITASGAGASPQRIAASSGDCAASSKAPSLHMTAAPAPSAPRTTHII